MKTQSIASHDLSDNTNAWGTAPASMAAMSCAVDASRYPSPYADALKSAISDYTGLAGSMIATGCGSDDVLDCSIRALGRPGDQLAFTAPTFPMIPTFASLNGLSPITVPFEELAGSGASVIYVCSPNNPTGALVPRDQIECLLAQASPRQAVIVDEAYAEFAGSSVVDLVQSDDRLVVTRTLSKAFGLAGIRVGYALGAPAMIAEIEKSRGPYKVSTMSERIAVAALTEGRAWMYEHALLASETRERFAVALRRRGFAPMASASNFLFIPVPDAPAVGRGMARRGVRVRVVGEPSGVRITIAPWPIMVEVLDALEEVSRTCA